MVAESIAGRLVCDAKLAAKYGESGGWQPAAQDDMLDDILPHIGNQLHKAL
jgi:hypothetical protein